MGGWWQHRSTHQAQGALDGAGGVTQGTKCLGTSGTASPQMTCRPRYVGFQGTVWGARRKVNCIATRPGTREWILRQGQHGWEKTLCLTQRHYSTSDSPRDCFVSLLLCREDSKSRNSSWISCWIRWEKKPLSTLHSCLLGALWECWASPRRHKMRRSAQSPARLRCTRIPWELPREPVLPRCTPVLPGSEPCCQRSAGASAWGGLPRAGRSPGAAQGAVRLQESSLSPAAALAVPRPRQQLLRELPAPGGLLHGSGTSLSQENLLCAEICHPAPGWASSRAPPSATDC